jgi:hypothetical protein
MKSQTEKYASADTLDRQTVERIIYYLDKEIKHLQRKIEKPVAYTDWTVYNKMINCAVQRMSMFKDDLQNIIDDKEAMQEFFKDIKDSGE